MSRISHLGLTECWGPMLSTGIFGVFSPKVDLTEYVDFMAVSFGIFGMCTSIKLITRFSHT